MIHYHACPCGAEDKRSEPEAHDPTCAILARRVNRVAALHSVLLGGALQNAELVFFTVPEVAAS